MRCTHGRRTILTELSLCYSIVYHNICCAVVPAVLTGSVFDILGWPARWSIPFWQPAYRLHSMCTCVFFTWQINSAAAAACYCLRRQFLRPFCGSAVMTSQQRHQDTSVDSNTQVDVVLASQLQHSWKSVICKGKGLNTCYSTAYMSQTGDQQRFTISEVAADWHGPVVPQRTVCVAIHCLG